MIIDRQTNWSIKTKPSKLKIISIFICELTQIFQLAYPLPLVAKSATNFNKLSSRTINLEKKEPTQLVNNSIKTMCVGFRKLFLQIFLKKMQQETL